MINNPNEDLNNKVNKGLIWNILERGSTQIINFVIQLVLARLLCPEDYGVIALLSVFISFSSTFVNCGLANALIQKKKCDETDMCTVFYTQLVIAIFFVVLLFLGAPFIGAYYKCAEYSTYLRVMSVGLLIDACYSIQLVNLKKNMKFDKLFFSNILGIIVQSVVGITMAIVGLGVWSLIISQLVYKITIYLILQIVICWKPKLLFSITRLKQLWSYSWKLFLGWIIGTLHQDIYALVIGKYFSTETLGYYNRGSNLPSIITRTVTETMTNVMFPVLSKLQDNEDLFKEQTRKMMTLTSFLIWPIAIGISAVSENFILVLLTDKWAKSISMMQLFSIAYGFNMISSTNMQAFNAIGRSDIFLKMEIIKRSISVCLLFVACILFSDIHVIISIIVVMGLFSVSYNSFMNCRLLKYSLKEQLSDCASPVILSIIMFLITQTVNLIPVNALIKLVLQITVGVLAYLGLSVIFKVKGIFLFKEFFKFRK